MTKKRKKRKRNPCRFIKRARARRRQLAKRRRKYRKTRKNPPKKLTKIYDKVICIVAIKDRGSNFPRQKFIHRFRKKAGVYGLANGNLLIK